MRGLLLRLFGLAAYALFGATLAGFVGFVCGLGMAKSVDAGPDAGLPVALAIDVALVAFFGVAHSVMARAGFKRAWTRVVPPAAERSVFVLVASAQIALLVWQWRPVAAPLWASSGIAALALRAAQLAGWAMALGSTFLLDHFELFGLRQTFERPAQAAGMHTPLLYRYLRHPMYAGMLLGLWAAPTMTAGHALLAALFTAYVLVGIRHEERDLVRVFGDAYRRYQREVPMLVPWPRVRVARLARGSVPK